MPMFRAREALRAEAARDGALCQLLIHDIGKQIHTMTHVMALGAVALLLTLLPTAAVAQDALVTSEAAWRASRSADGEIAQRCGNIDSGRTGCVRQIMARNGASSQAISFMELENGLL